MSNFRGQFFHVFKGKQNLNFLKKFGGSKSFFRAGKFSNLSVLHKDLLMQDWIFRLGEAR